MKIYIVSLIVGVLVGVLYGVLNVRSPAPPTWALAGLLGMLLGEDIVKYTKQHFSKTEQVQVQQQQSAQSPVATKATTDKNGADT
ncbi:DUF1427 family protein [Psychrobacter lutiphocae]|uniref:DUF1427 family protein n=1 Tax=Psychrobacter lutiphocae TaxID=540500 RepID=UPI00036FCE11|nr:DUF1427 family protein [Psychrobacter lutiphocae]